MKNRISLYICLILGVVYISFRLHYDGNERLNLTSWDGLGYYMYTPSLVIYNDMTELKWIPKMDSIYQLSGGHFYQATLHSNGNYVNKYLGGVAILQSPFFFVGHLIAKNSNYRADGFSPPYQWSIAFGALIYFILGLLILRIVLLRFYSDRIVTITLILLTLATNLIQYTSVDSGLSHVYIFPLYAAILWLTIRWHDSPAKKWAFLIGATIGLATICRPTEAIMLFIPMLWGTQDKAERKIKWQLVRNNRTHVYFAIIGGLIAISPQLIYWKMTAGTFIYDVGSKWFFLTPFFRVIFGFENGWFVYTPITILFVIGLFFMKGKPFRKSVLVFCLLNIWIIISWADWKYGATYSTRALVQSYPVFALAFAGIVKWIEDTRFRFVFYTLGVYLIIVNLFQVWQYNENILHYRDMNRKYYAAIYLDPSPTPLDMSLLDTDEYLSNTETKKKEVVVNQQHNFNVTNEGEYPDIIATAKFDLKGNDWIKVDVTSKALEGYYSSFWNCKLICGEVVKEKMFRMTHAMADPEKENKYSFYMQIPNGEDSCELLLFSTSWEHFKGDVKNVKVTHYYD